MPPALLRSPHLSVVDYIFQLFFCDSLLGATFFELWVKQVMVCRTLPNYAKLCKRGRDVLKEFGMTFIVTDDADFKEVDLVEVVELGVL